MPAGAAVAAKVSQCKKTEKIESLLVKPGGFFILHGLTYSFRTKGMQFNRKPNLRVMLRNEASAYLEKDSPSLG